MVKYYYTGQYLANDGAILHKKEYNIENILMSWN